MFENVERLRDFSIPIIRLSVSVFCCFFVSGKTMMEVLSLVYCPWCLSDCSHIQIMSASFQSVKNMLNHKTVLFFLSWSHLRSVDSQVRCPSHVSRSHVSYVSWAATQDCPGPRVSCLTCHLSRISRVYMSCDSRSSRSTCPPRVSQLFCLGLTLLLSSASSGSGPRPHTWHSTTLIFLVSGKERRRKIYFWNVLFPKKIC